MNPTPKPRNTVPSAPKIAANPQSSKNPSILASPGFAGGYKTDTVSPRTALGGLLAAREALAPVEGADPKTFQLFDGGYARDAKRWYTHQGAWLDDVGDNARIDDSLYFLPLILLIGERSVYLGDYRLSIDAASCEVVRTKPLRRDPLYGGLLWLRDREGDCIVSRWGRFGEKSDPVVRRSADAEGAWIQGEVEWESLVASGIPTNALRDEIRKARDDSANATVFIQFFEDWVSRHLDSQWHDSPYNSFVWEGIECYFEMLGRVGESERLLAFYDKVEAEAWCRPQVYLHTALARLAQGRLEDALEETRRAARTSYHAALKMFEVPAIRALLEREDAADLKAFAAYVEGHPSGKPVLPAELAAHWLDATQDRHKALAIQNIFAQFQIPGAPLLESLRSVDTERAEFCEEAYARFMNTSVLDAATRHFPAYDARRNYAVWGDLPGLNPAVHLIAASSLYSEGFFWIDQKADGPRLEFERAETALRRAKSLAKETLWRADTDWQRIAGDPLYAPLLDLVSE